MKDVPLDESKSEAIEPAPIKADDGSGANPPVRSIEPIVDEEQINGEPKESLETAASAFGKQKTKFTHQITIC